jgi:pSer/pThr/pTyr-binding forkhead associated (FHA) protein
MEAGICPSFYSNLVPNVYDVYLYIDDWERLRLLESRIRKEAVTALGERLTALNKANRPRLKLPLTSAKKTKRYESLDDWSVEFHENTDEDARESPLAIHSSFPAAIGPDDRAGTLTERVTKRRTDGQTVTTSTTRSVNLETVRASGLPYANLTYEDDFGSHTYPIDKDLVKVGRGSADHWVDLKLKTKKDVSREHLQIRRDPATGRFFIKDLSTLGTTVNGRRVPASIEMVNGQEVDRNLEVPLEDKSRIGLADVLSLNFRTVLPR